MSEILILILVWIAGFVLGGIFFGGLGWTTYKGTLSKKPALWFGVSFILRMGVVLVGFYFVSSGHLVRFLFCLLGFIVARIFIIRLTDFIQEENHAS